MRHQLCLYHVLIDIVSAVASANGEETLSKNIFAFGEDVVVARRQHYGASDRCWGLANAACFEIWAEGRHHQPWLLWLQFTSWMVRFLFPLCIWPSKHEDPTTTSMQKGMITACKCRWMVQQISEAAKQSPDTIERGKDTLLTVFFGANDSVGPHIFLHVPLEEYGDNLRKIVRRSKEVLPDVTIVLISPPPIDEEAVLR